MLIDRMSTLVINLKIISESIIQNDSESINSKKGKFRLEKTFLLNPETVVQILIFYLVLDLMSHFLYFTSCLYNNKSHKKPKNFFLKIYYKKHVLVFLIIMNETFYISIYGSKILKIFNFGIYLSIIFYHIKRLANVFQLIEGVYTLSKIKNNV
ncbi:CDP-diacylglycerol--inositol 3-phosphatidyltransferase [Dictyocoela muelleri]|nr:CDP-diacylglycerol--inositol 3-phosphatidyltransferase [Dictyocoela muelleri]